MNRVMEALQDEGLLKRALKPREKLWNTEPEKWNATTHYPVHLGRVAGEHETPLAYKYIPLDLVADEVRLVVLQGASEYEAPLVAQLAMCQCTGILFTVHFRHL